MFERMKMEREGGRRGGVDGSIAEQAPTTASFPIATTERRAEQKAIKLRTVGLNERLKNLNTYSSFLNIVTLTAFTWHLVYLGQGLQTQFQVVFSTGLLTTGWHLYALQASC